MKKTQVKDARRNIRNRIVSYLSICLVIMLGVGAFLTTRYMEAGIVEEAAGYYRDRNFKDFELISSLGASEASIETIRGVEGVTDAEGVMEYEGSLQSGDAKDNVIALSLTERVSVPRLTEGSYPSAAGECAIGEDFAEVSGIKVGNKATIYLRNPGGDDPLRAHEYTVTGLIQHPDYVHRKLNNIVVLPLGAFNMDASGNAYTRVFVRANDVAFEDYFTPAYFEQTSATKQGLKDISSYLADSRATEVRDEAYDEIDKEWEKAEAELVKAQNEIDSGEAELNSRLADGRKQLNNAESTLAKKVKEYNKKIKTGEASIADSEKQLKEAKAELSKAKKSYEKAKELFEENTGWMDDGLTETDYLLTHVDDADADKPADYADREKALAKTLIEHKSQLTELEKAAKTDEVSDAAKEIKKQTGKDLMPLIDKIRNAGVEAILSKAEAVETGEDHFTKEELTALKGLFETIRGSEVKEAMDKAEKEIADAEKEIAANEKLLNSKKEDLKKGKQQLKQEKAAAEKKIQAGWSKYYSEKSKYESKLAEAKALLAENREEAEKKLQEARDEVAEIDCEWIVLDLKANPGYLDVKVSLDSLRSTGLVFGILFILITAIVCFSTLTIIIEEQKKLIGTVKAFGFHKAEVMGKYLLFGVSAGIVGDILAIITGYIISTIVQAVYSASNLYQYGHPATIVKPVPTIIISLVMIAICALASVIACADILRSPASMLMKGETIRSKKAGGRKTVAHRSGGSLYSRLILRNMRDDKVRVAVSTVIVAFCCMLMGVGLSFKLATTGMLARQADDINLFDLRMDIGDSVSEKDHAALLKVLDESGADYSEVAYESRLFETGESLTGLTLLACDPEAIGDYLGIRAADGSVPEISDEGILIPVRMRENYGFEPGGDINILDSSMRSRSARVTGSYTMYFGRLVITTPAGYRTIFGEDYSPNACYIHLNGADASALKDALNKVSGDLSFEASSDFRESFDSVGQLYDIIVYVTTGVAIFMSFMILTNLANIFLTRKKNELIVMRINGFSIGQTRSYLSREAILTTVVGLAAGIIIGSLFAPAAVRILEPADLQFDRSYKTIAWAVSAGLEGLFSLIIYSSTFRKIKKFNLKDIA